MILSTELHEVILDFIQDWEKGTIKETEELQHRFDEMSRLSRQLNEQTFVILGECPNG
ncbi:MAG: hypothetical protein HC773_05575 [Scytonema sp. CRU_2_7]|nr:hypothetical protein [Scytonema sp. CRU_2_7]